MSKKYSGDTPYFCTTFSGGDISDALLDVYKWLQQVNPSGKTNEFYFMDLRYSYDDGDTHITIYHGELK